MILCSSVCSCSWLGAGAPLATERHQRVARACVAAQPQEALGQNAAVEIGLEFVFDELRQPVYFGNGALVVLPHQPIQQRLFGTAALVIRRAGSRFAQGGCAHEVIGV